MKKILLAAAFTLLFSTAVYAQSVDFPQNVAEDKAVEITGLEEGYYDITATCKNAVVNGSFLYGEGSATASTVLPLSEGGVKVTVKGVYVDDGVCKVGVAVKAENALEISNVEINKSKKFDFIQGGDMTEVSYIESLGGKYRDEAGNEVDVFDYFGKNGVNMARIRLSNTTGKGTGDGTYYLPEGFQDEADCLALSKRAKDAGMGIQFTFNYSDYWSNGDRQIIPSEWVKAIKDDLGYDVKDAAFLNGMTAAQKKEIQTKLGDLIYEYTFDIMTKLKAQGTVPEYVSLGNEINGGMFFPFGNTFDANMNKDRFELVYGGNISDSDIKCYKDWAGLASMLNRGYDAVKAVAPESQVVIHLANGSKDSIFTWFLSDYIKAGGKFDVIGASYYPAWSHNPIETCVSFCNTISKKYDKDILIMETGYNWSENKKNGYGGQLTPTEDDPKNAPGYTEKYPFTQEGHAAFMADLMNGLKSVDGGRCLGFLYWDPCMIHVEDPANANESLSGWAIRESDDKPDGNVVENTTLFDFDGKAVYAMNVFKNSQNSVPKRGFTGGYTAADGAVTATVTNNTSEVKTANLYVVTYEANGLLKDVKIDTKPVQSGESVTLTLPEPSEAYRVFLWDGDTLAPIEKK